MIRNLLYNCCPLSATREVWQDNVRRLCKYPEAFNGKRVVIVRTGEGMDDPETVEPAFDALGDVEFLRLPNHPTLHEVSGFIETLEEHFFSLDADEITFYAHTKGVGRVARFPATKVSVMQWRNRMYHECLSDLGRIEEAMKTHAACGCFLHPEYVEEKLLWTRWMFSGTFFWFRHDRVFGNPNWKFMGPEPVKRHAVENYLGAHFDRTEVFCLYGEGYLGGLYTSGLVKYRCRKCQQEFYGKVPSTTGLFGADPVVRSKCCNKPSEKIEVPEMPDWVEHYAAP
jgi:hypothetical protein